MGTKANRKKEFLAKHQYCCFCGGGTRSEEPDHIPSRVLFDNRQWPEGYEFPSCISCNRESRHDEQVVAMLSRMYPDADTDEKQKEVNERIRAVARNYPKLLDELSPSVRQIRDVMKKYNISKPEGMTTADMPFLNVGGPLVSASVENFARKLFLALYYFHTREILPDKGGIAIRWFTNIQIEDDAIPSELQELVSGFPTLQRSKMELADQFFYRYRITDDKKSAVFLAFFRRSFSILGFVNDDKDKFQLPDETTILGPYVHASRLG